jgi:protein-disulfide isomerase
MMHTPPAPRLRRTLATSVAVVALVAASWTGAAGQEEPELTWAPLVTPPPVVEPFVTTPQELADGFALGSADAPVTVEVWEDFQCPYCQLFALEVKPALVSRYVESGEARLVFRNLAFLGQESHWAAVAAALAAEQNRFWPLHDYLFTNFLGRESGSFHLDRLLEMGERAGLDMDEFRTGLALGAARERWAEIDAEARAAAVVQGIASTPTVVVNGVVLDSPDVASVSAAIDAVLAGEDPEAAPSGEVEGPPAPNAGE